MIRIDRKNRGVTLIELMIVLVIAAILVGGVYSLFITQQRSYAVQDQVAGVQQDARAALNIMARDIRMAGFVVGPGSSTGFTDGVSTITIPSTPPGEIFSFAIQATNRSDGSDRLTVVSGAEELGIVESIAGQEVTLDKNVNTKCNYIAFDMLPGMLFKLTDAADDDKIVTVENVPTGNKIVGGKAYGVKAITYLVDQGVLRRNENTGSGAQPLAGDGINTVVEDLQFAYSDDGQNWFNTPPSSTPKMVRINITVRTAIADATVQDANPTVQFRQPPLEDHTTNLNGPDGFRRRVYTTEVKARNL